MLPENNTILFLIEEDYVSCSTLYSMNY